MTSRTRVRTRLLCGIDEAGLGPLLGPLAIGYAALSVPRDDPDPWRFLRRVVAKRPNRSARLVVADSKRVFARNARGRRRLERTALSFLALLEPQLRPPSSADGLLLHPAGPGPSGVEGHPWYTALPPLPRANESGAIELATARLSRELERRGAALRAAGVRLVPAGELNASFEQTGNKGATVWERVAEVLRYLWSRFGAEDPEVTVDVLGGRMRYGALLARSLEGADVRVERETPECSAYTLGEAASAGPDPWLPRRMRVCFRVHGEDASFPVALASCLAKYARELVMEAFNSWFERLQPGLVATAGYRTDAARWLAEAGPALARAGVAEECLIRRR